VGPQYGTCHLSGEQNFKVAPRFLENECILAYTEYTQKNGAVSMVNKGKPHHSFVYTLYTINGAKILKEMLH
jgi:hypothetical protein